MLRVASVEAREKRTNPVPPFTTSKLQQGAARSLGFTVRRTMQVAQRLYEGKTISGRGSVGLITYMRTDSTRVSEEALGAVRGYIGATCGADALPAEPRRFKQKKDAQDAHEAIRPTMMDLPPESVAGDVSADELKLYRLIWNRFVASQMSAVRLGRDDRRDRGGEGRQARDGRRPRQRLRPEGRRAGSASTARSPRRRRPKGTATETAMPRRGRSASRSSPKGTSFASPKPRSRTTRRSPRRGSTKPRS